MTQKPYGAVLPEGATEADWTTNWASLMPAFKTPARSTAAIDEYQQQIEA